jgi:hypothetical protein
MIPEFTPSAVEIRTHLVQLEAERVEALENGMAEIDLYMADLDEEIETWRQYFVSTAVTEIATLQGELFGIQVG